jgi:protocatechuate 3,4-dioxygenase beta subunit
MSVSRRDLVAGFFATPALTFLSGRYLSAQTSEFPLPLTPACDDDHEIKPQSAEGPFYKPQSPLRSNLTADLPGGVRLRIGGHVVDRSCHPVSGAIVELWQADANGQYDIVGNRLRGYQISDEGGRWSFNTIIPGLHTGRTRHIHFKVQRPGGRVLTTQMFFPGEPANDRDFQFIPPLLIEIEKVGSERLGRFDFAIA